jgi:photosystem II stability/assembly factor-like uncharacterized protein
LTTAGCDRESYLVVKVPTQPAAAIARLRVSALLDGATKTAELPAEAAGDDGGSGLTLPTSLILRLPADARGAIDLTVDEQLADGTTMYAQRLTAPLSADGKSEVTIQPGPPWLASIVTLNANALNGMWAVGPTTIYAAGGGGTILRTGDGSAWTPETSSTNQNLQSIWGSGPNDIYAVGNAATIVHSTGAGDWTVLPAPTTAAGKTLHLVWGSGPDQVYIVGDGGLMLSSTNHGQSWQTIATPVTTMLNIVWGASAGHVLISGEKGAILRSINNGASWTTVRAADNGYIWSIWGTGADDIYAAGMNGVILHSGDDGVTWTAQNSGKTATFFGCSAGLANDVFCVADAGTIVHTSDHGNTWVSIPSGVGGVLNWAVAVPAFDTVLVCGDSGQMLRYF